MKGSLALFALMPTTSAAFSTHRLCSSNHPLQRNPRSGCHDVRHKSTALNIYRSAAAATSEAEYVCMVEGPHSDRCAVAWDIVEELKAADADDRTETAGAHELSYIPLVQGLNILSDKLGRKLGELKKLSTQMAEAGAGPEVERLVYASDEMLQILEEATTAVSRYQE